MPEAFICSGCGTSAEVVTRELKPDGSYGPWLCDDCIEEAENLAFLRAAVAALSGPEAAVDAESEPNP